jgi:polyferredoxin
MAKNKTSWILWLRRSIQAVFLVLFFYLFLQAAYHPINKTGGHVTLFFEIDPLVMITVWIAAHAVVAALLLSLVTLAVTVFFGRWFCGWICPLGTLHNLFTSMRGGRLKVELEQGGYTRWQQSKYYVLAFFLGGALAGANLVGWLDPFSFLYRSMATAVFPVINYGIQKLFGWVYQTDPGLGSLRLTAITEPVYEVLRRYFLAVNQPHYFWSLMIGLLFGVALALNFLRARFWCRYACPLGALLGVVGKNPMVRLATDPAACSDCRLCLVDCQGGADPQGKKPWRAAECFYCWNCHSSCPSDAISFRFDIPEAKKP